MHSADFIIALRRARGGSRGVSQHGHKRIYARYFAGVVTVAGGAVVGTSGSRGMFEGFRNR
jgi:hypothetical protein